MSTPGQINVAYNLANGGILYTATNAGLPAHDPAGNPITELSMRSTLLQTTAFC
jgi:hypothetical protein